MLMVLVLVWEFLSVFHCQVDHPDFAPIHTERHPLLEGLNGDIHMTPDNRNNTQLFFDSDVMMCTFIC
jgi:hypothetical protein